MLLYKFRAFGQFEYLLDILLHERLYCAPYRDLGDPFEGMFSAVTRATIDSFHAGQPIARDTVHSADELIAEAKGTRVCSLSECSHDVRMWSYYAAGHTGLAIEIDFSNHVSDGHPVKYLPGLPYHSVGLLNMPTATDILSRKTSHWEFETEFRIIGHDVYYPIPNRIRRVLVGPLAPPTQVDLLAKVLENKNVPIVKTRLNHRAVRVEPVEPTTNLQAILDRIERA